MILLKTDYKKIGKFIAQLRKENKMTQGALAEKLFVDRTTISKWELGENSINTETLIKISEVFDITINEMILGERISKENVESISNVTVGALRKNVVFKKYLSITIIIILILFLSFLSYYFINNFNSIMVYDINYDDNNFSIHNGIMVISREKVYINLGNIENNNGVNIISEKLYYTKGNKTITFYERNDLGGSYVSDYKDSEFKYGDLKYLISNMFLEIIFNDNEMSVLKLELSKSYSNNRIIPQNESSLKQDDINDLYDNIPTYIKDNFDFNSNDNSYYLEEKREDKTIKYTYFVDANVYMVEEVFDGYRSSFTYSKPDITYSETSDNGKIIKEFVYVLDSNECITGECNKDLIEYFKNEYLSMLT